VVFGETLEVNARKPGKARKGIQPGDSITFLAFPAFLAVSDFYDFYGFYGLNDFNGLNGFNHERTRSE
jgi:hypothetical protein